MTLEEAQKISDIIGTADGGCSHCVSNILPLLRKTFPEFEWTVEGEFQHDYERDEKEPDFYDAEPSWELDDDAINIKYRSRVLIVAKEREKKDVMS